MNRIYKFRAWDKENKEFIYFTLDELTERRLIEINNLSSVLLKFLNANKQQFTGLKDKNGKDVYEGDIVIDINDPERKVVIKFEDGAFYPFWDKEVIIDNRQRYENGREVNSYYFEDLEDVKIIGNIYENSDLIKEA